MLNNFTDEQGNIILVVLYILCIVVLGIDFSILMI